MCKFESLQSEENRAQSTDSSKACSKPRAFNYCCRSLSIDLFLGQKTADELLKLPKHSSKTTLPFAFTFSHIEGTRPSKIHWKVSSKSEDIKTKPWIPFSRSTSDLRMITSKWLYLSISCTLAKNFRKHGSSRRRVYLMTKYIICCCDWPLAQHNTC